MIAVAFVVAYLAVLSWPSLVRRSWSGLLLTYLLFGLVTATLGDGRALADSHPVLEAFSIALAYGLLFIAAVGLSRRGSEGKWTFLVAIAGLFLVGLAVHL
jgi:hypothetical protein